MQNNILLYSKRRKTYKNAREKLKRNFIKTNYEHPTYKTACDSTFKIDTSWYRYRRHDVANPYNPWEWERE